MKDVIVSRIRLLAQDPVSLTSKKLMNRDGWRIRVGDYRILYTVDYKKQEITILSIAHRKEAYRLF